jgi:hypothetical protein
VIMISSSESCGSYSSLEQQGCLSDCPGDYRSDAQHPSRHPSSPCRPWLTWHGPRSSKLGSSFAQGEHGSCRTLIGSFWPWAQYTQAQTKLQPGNFSGQKLYGDCTYKRGVGCLWSTCGGMKLGLTFFTVPTIQGAAHGRRGPKGGLGGPTPR